MPNPDIIDRIELEYRQKTEKSRDLFAEACHYIPGGSSRSLVVFPPYPLAINWAKGSRFKDIDGNEYIDFVNCQSALVHGHAHPRINEAIAQQITKVTASSQASEEEIVLARMLCERVRSVQKVRFCCSGTEAAMYAIRLARAYTGKETILKFEGGYHGSYDDVEMSKVFRPEDGGKPHDPDPVMATGGFPTDITKRVLVAPFNDHRVLARRIDENKDSLAAVILEPMLAAGGMIPPTEGFLSYVRELTRKNRILLIADEVVTFRLSCGGGQEAYGFEADLTILGKLIGGGLPVAAVGGREDILMLSKYQSDGPVPSKLSLSGTFNGAAVGMAAGIAALEALDPQAIRAMNDLGDCMREQIRRALKEVGVAGQVTGNGSLLQLHFTSEPVKDYRSAASAARSISRPLHLWLLNNGISAYPRCGFSLSTAITKEEVDLAVATLRGGLSELRPYIQAVAPRLVV